MMRQFILFPMLACMLLISSCQDRISLKVMQFNIWQEGTIVPEGFDGIVDEIANRKPDLVALSEVRNYGGKDFMKRLIEALKEKQLVYYADSSSDTGILSKYEIISQTHIFPYRNDRGSVIKATLKIKGQRVALYSGHLDWLEYACFLPRGYDPNKFQKIEKAVLNKDSILAGNRASFRDDQIKAIINDAKSEITNGAIVLIGGDFNEPSHVDWDKNTADMRSHNGCVIPWDCSIMLEKEGYIDVFRQIYPDPVRFPGFTFPANNQAVELKKLVWAAEVDERDRVDFIYYYPHKNLILKDVHIIGPSGAIIQGERVTKDPQSEDLILPPISIWPTDHKALIATFELRL